MLFDSHCHLNFKEFNENWQNVIEDCKREKIKCIVVGSQFETSKKGVMISESFPDVVYSAVGLHPIHVEGSKFKPELFVISDYELLIKKSKSVVAIGETGIDFFHEDNNFEKQKEVFIQHIELALKHSLPLIIHNRNSKDGTKNSYKEVLNILKDFPDAHGVAHCFGGTLKEALMFIEKGFYIGCTGIITFDKSGILKEIIQSIPFEKLLIETDSPYLAPMPHRGKTNTPLHVRYVAQAIAEIKQINYNEVAYQTASNAKKLFNLS